VQSAFGGTGHPDEQCRHPPVFFSTNVPPPRNGSGFLASISGASSTARRCSRGIGSRRLPARGMSHSNTYPAPSRHSDPRRPEIHRLPVSRRGGSEGVHTKHCRATADAAGAWAAKSAANMLIPGFVFTGLRRAGRREAARRAWTGRNRQSFHGFGSWRAGRLLPTLPRQWTCRARSDEKRNCGGGRRPSVENRPPPVVALARRH